MLLCLDSGKGKGQGRRIRPAAGGWRKSIKCWWCQTPAGAGGKCLVWDQEGRLIPSNLEDSFTQHYTSHISLSVTNNNHRLRDTHIGVLISVRDLVTLSISSLRRDYLTSRLRLCSVGESPSNWGSQESTVLYCAVLCAPCTGSRKQGSACYHCNAVTDGPTWTSGHCL